MGGIEEDNTGKNLENNIDKTLGEDNSSQAEEITNFSIRSFKESNPPKIVKNTMLATISLSAFVSLASILVSIYLMINKEDSILALFFIAFSIFLFITALVFVGLLVNSIKVYRGSKKGLKTLEKYAIVLLALSCLPPTPTILIYGVLLYMLKREEFKTYCVLAEGKVTDSINKQNILSD